MILRPYQDRTIAETRARIQAGARAVCVVGPCGMGKTIIGCEVARLADERRKNILWLAHRHELVDQAAAQLTVPARTGTVQGLLASGERPPADIVVLDEAHHFGTGAAKWHGLAQDYSSSYLLGLTATPARGDGTPLSPPFDQLVVAATYSEMLKGGWIVPAEVWAPPKRLRGIAKPMDAWLEHASTLRTVVYAANIGHAEQLAEQFTAAGTPAVNVDGSMPWSFRRARLQAFRDGDVQILTSVHILTEGFDDPGIECVVLARGFSHVGSYLQAVGRALRPQAGKRRALILDLGGAVHDHGMPDEDRTYSLTGTAIRQTSQDAGAPLRQCQWCGAVFRGSQPNCPRCGRRVAMPATPQEKRAKLERVREASSVDSRSLHWAKLRAQGKAKGYKPGWAAYRYKAIYGRWPEREGKAVQARTTGATTRGADKRWSQRRLDEHAQERAKQWDDEG